MRTITLRTGVWYNDRTVELAFPASWDVEVHRPSTPAPLTDSEILGRIEHPVCSPPLSEMAKGKKRPCIVVDDLSRPTPVFKVMPFILDQLKSAGIPPSEIRILVATGTHGGQNHGALARKIGKEAFEACRVIVHNDLKGTRLIGKTSFKTPVYVNKEALQSDLLVGVGGVYPQHTTGFGGGAKLALGIMGRRSIMHLHFKHKAVGGTYNIHNDFRRDVTEAARMMGLRKMYTLHINEDLELVNLFCGDHFSYYEDAARFSMDRYSAPPPGDAEVVIANGYPFDVSFTFMRKAFKPLDLAGPGATKIMVASNHEGIGEHGLFQHMRPSRFQRYRDMYNRVSIMEPGVIFSKVLKKLAFQGRPAAKKDGKNERYSVPRKTGRLLLYRPPGNSAAAPQVDGIEVTESWTDLIKVIEREHSGKDKVRVRVYPCAALQCISGLIGTSSIGTGSAVNE